MKKINMFFKLLYLEIKKERLKKEYDKLIREKKVFKGE